MKKSIFIMMIFAGMFFSACEKDEVGGTATQALAGEWYVTASQVDDNLDVVYDDLFGMGQFMVNTYNTAANVADEMWVSDMGNFWDFSVKVNCDSKALTFSTSGTVANYSYEDCDVTIEGGKIMYGAATTPHGTPADSIVFYVSFSDDPYPAYYGYSKHMISGYRYTGLESDD